jgi:hypothetical protein
MSVECAVLECAQAVKGSSDASSWINCVHRTGISLLPGDTIGLEMAALHVQGVDGDIIEVSGDQTDADVQGKLRWLIRTTPSTIVAEQRHASHFGTV